MKKTIFLSVLIGAFLFSVAAFAQQVNWHVTNQVTVVWDAPTTLSNGNPIPSDNSLKYRVYIKRDAPDAQAQEVTTDPISETQYTITLSEEGRYFVGVRALRFDANDTQISESAISWSNDPNVVANGEEFGVQYFVPPSPADGIRLR